MNFINSHFHRIFGGDCRNFHAVKMGLSSLAFKWFMVLLIFNQIMVSGVSAQTTLERLEQQIRQRVSPSQEGAPPRRWPATPPPPVISQPSASPSLDKAQATDQTEPGYLGVTADDRKDRGRGVRITEVRRGSPAEKAGIRTQDLVTGLLDMRVRQLSEMTEILQLYQPGDVVEFDILRDDAPQKIKVTLGHRPAPPAPISQTAEIIPLPPGELIVPKTPPAKITPPPVKTNSPNDSETIEQLQNRILELERRMADLERALSEAQKNNK